MDYDAKTLSLKVDDAFDDAAAIAALKAKGYGATRQ